MIVTNCEICRDFSDQDWDTVFVNRGMISVTRYQQGTVKLQINIYRVAACQRHFRLIICHFIKTYDTFQPLKLIFQLKLIEL